MGRKIINAAMSLTAVSNLVLIVSLFLPQHAIIFFLGGFLPVLDIKTYTLSAAIESCAGSKLSICEKLSGEPSLEELSHRVCAGGVRRIFHNMCDGYHNAFTLGLTLTIVVVANVCMQGAAGYALYYYMAESTRRKYRKLAMLLQVIGIFLVVAVHSVYYGLVMVRLSSIRSANAGAIIGTILSPGTGHGVSYGYIFIWVGCLIQVFAIILTNWAKTTSEEYAEEAREQAKFQAEFQEVEMSGYGQSPASSVPLQPGFGSPAGSVGVQPGMMPMSPRMQQAGLAGPFQQPGLAYNAGVYQQGADFGIGGGVRYG